MIMKNKGWTILSDVDEDGRLKLLISHDDGTTILKTESDFTRDIRWGDKFSTLKIENDNLKNESLTYLNPHLMNKE
jgi:hypothetical protein